MTWKEFNYRVGLGLTKTQDRETKGMEGRLTDPEQTDRWKTLTDPRQRHRLMEGRTPRQRETQTQSVAPDGDDGGEQHDESAEVAEPLSHEALQRDHDEGQHHLGQEQGLGEAVQLQVQQAHLQGPETQVRARVYRTAGEMGGNSRTESLLFRFISMQSSTMDHVKLNS